MSPPSRKESALCPPRDALMEFVRGQLPEPAASGIRDHLSSCEWCSTAADELSTDVGGGSSFAVSDESTFSLGRGGAPVGGAGGAVTDGPTAAWSPPAEPLREAASKPPKAAIPEKIGRYFVLRAVGSPSGFGRVYKAKDTERNRIVAVKVPQAKRLATSDAVTEFLREARAAAELQHENILQVYDWGRLEDGGCYIVMPFIDGPSLDRVLDVGRLPLRRAVRIAIQIARALHHAHVNHMFHRDVKPANILLADEDRALLADFGLVLHREDRADRRGEVAGTARYMAPEQLLGETPNLDGRTDLWGLGVVLYEMLCGQRPFEGATREEIRRQILHHHPTPPEQLDESVPASLSRLCMRCLSKDISERPASGRELAEALQRELRGLGRPVVPLVRRRFLGAAAAAVAVGAAGRALTPHPEPGEMAWASSTRHWPIERDAAVGRPRPYLRPPAAILYPPSSLTRGAQPPTLQWTPLFQELRIHDSPSLTLAALNETRAQDFRLKVVLSPPEGQPWSGGAGVFWGYRRKFDERGAAYTECSAIVLEPFRLSYRLRGYRLFFVKVDTPLPETQTISTWSSDKSSDARGKPPREIEQPKQGEPVTLELTFQNGQLTRLGYQGGGFPLDGGRQGPSAGLFGVLSWDNAEIRFHHEGSTFTPYLPSNSTTEPRGDAP